MKNILLKIFGGKVVHSNSWRPKVPGLLPILLMAIMLISTNAFAQGSIFGVVANSDLSTPANGQITFVGYLDDTDEEIRLESSDGAGYDAGNWFDDFQNYLTEAPGNPYDYVFYNTSNGQGHILSALIPNNSFQQENVLLGTVSWPSAVTGLAGSTVSGSSVILRWNGTPGITYHVYRRAAISNGSFFRLDNPAGLLSDPGVADSFYVDTGVDGVSSYDYVLIAEDGSGNWSPHSAILTVNSGLVDAPVLASISPNSGIANGGNLINVFGSGFDPAGTNVNLGLAIVSATVLSPMHLTIITPAAAAGPVDVSVANIASGQISNTLTNGFTFTPNATPVLAAIGPQSTTEGVLLQFAASATDIDGDIPVLTTTALPAGASFTDSLNGNGLFDWTPGFLDAGVYNVTFYATDGVTSLLIDSEQVQITILEAGNQLPIFAPVNDTSLVEGTALVLAISATDPEAAIPTLTTSALPANASFVDNGDGTGNLTFNPDFTQAGVYNVTFYAADLVGNDSIQVAITVTEAGNQLPVLAAIGPQSVAESAVLAVPVSATDAEGIPTLATSLLPTGASFTDNGDGSGQLDWTPDFTQAGIYNVTFYASDGVDTDSELVVVTVTDAGNQIPVLAAIGPQAVTENVLLSVAVTATDPDGTIPTLTTSTPPTGALFTDNGDGSGSFDWTPSFTDAGTYNVTFYASDGVEIDSEQVTITVNEAGNQSPVMTAVNDTTILEGTTLLLALSAVDPDAEIPTMTTSALPANAGFVDNGDGTGTLTFTPDFTQTGIYNVSFYASDLVATDSISVAITVTDAGNQIPVLAAIGPQTINENVLLSFTVTASDPDATIPLLTTTALPTGAIFTDNFDGTGSFDWTPSFTDAGTYNVTFYASDGVQTDSEQVVITVNEVGNQDPILAAIGPQTVTENVLLTFGVSASDPDGTIPTFSTSTLPAGALFTDNTDGTGSFDWTPTFTDAGTYNVTFYATDGIGTDSELVVITVNEAGNQIPVLAVVNDTTIVEGTTLLLALSAADPDAEIPIMTTSALPTNASFVDNGDGTGTLTFTPDFTQTGIYNVSFYASDLVATDSISVAITVTEAGNQIPVLAAIGPQVTSENVLLTVAVLATDPDGTIPVLTTSTLPGTAVFLDNGDGSGSFDWTPSFTDSGTYNVTFYASDGIEIDSEQVVITVNDAGNQIPVLAVIGPQAVTENVLLTFAVSASDPEGIIPVLSTSVLPGTALFTDNGNGTGTFDWIPSFADSGIYNVVFYASDGIDVDSEQVTITVADAGNHPPVLAPINDTAIVEGDVLVLDMSASDLDLEIPTLSTSILPANALFADNGDGTGSLTFSPDFNQVGVYNVSFYASDLAATDSISIVITVIEAGNQTPILATIGVQATIENVPVSFIVSATDPDGTIPFLSMTTLPAGALFTDNGDGSGIFDWTPDFTQAGLYNITFYASDGVAIDSETVQIAVTEVGNQLPVLSAIGPQSVVEGLQLLIPILATDADNIPILSASTLPVGAIFTDNGDGTGLLDWTPTFTDSGTYNVTFYATDGLATDSEAVTITVIEAGNQIPVLAAIGPQAVIEGVLLSLGVSATDGEGIPALSTSTLPTGAVFADSGDGTGLFVWTPTFTDSGTYSVTFYATDGLATDSELVTITVTEAGNQIPVLAAIGPQGTTENVQLLVNLSATDADGTIPVLSTSALPTGALFTDNLDGTGAFDWTPGFADAGTYNVTFYASDGVGTDSEQVLITVVEAGNQTPILTAIGPQAGTENIQLIFPVTATDPEGAIPVLTTSTLPAGAIFTDSANGSGLFDWTPSFIQSGIYNITFYASDGVAIDSELVTFTIVDGGNQPPLLTLIGDRFIIEGAQLIFGVTAVDPESIPILSTSALPTGATFVDSANGSGLFDWTPGFAQAGTYLLTFYASDGVLVDSEQIIITVSEAGSQAPIVTVVPDTSVNEGNVLSVVVTAIDPDGGAVFITANHRLNNFTFVDSGNGTAVLTYSPDFFDGGIDSIVFLATDFDIPQQSGQAITVITTVETNQAPSFEFIGPQNAEVNRTLTITVRAHDSTDANILHLLYLSALNLPANATFVDNNDKTGTFSFTPQPGQEGIVTVTFVVTDQGIPQLTTNMPVTITVQATNSLPVMVPIGPQTVVEGNTLTINLSAADPDGNIPFFTADTSNLQGNGTFVDNGDGTAVFTFTPGFVQAGLAYVTFFAHDGIDFVKEVVLIQIYEAGDQPPLFGPLPSPSVTEGTTGEALITAFDPDTLPVTIYVVDSALPPNFSFFDSGNGSAVLTMSPDFTQSGVYILTLGVSDGNLADTTTLVVTIVDGGNQKPTMAPIADYTIDEVVNLNFGVSATDLDGIPLLSMSSATLPAAATLTDNGNGTATFNWTPGNFDAAVHSVMFFATDDTDPLLADSQQVFIIVNDVNQIPNIIFYPLLGQADTVSEGDTLWYTALAKDPDSTIPTITAVLDGTNSLPANMVLDSTYIDVANNWRISVLRFTPDFTQGGPLNEPTQYQIRFKACDEMDSTLCNMNAPVVLKVFNKNQAPQLFFQPNAGPFTITEGETVLMTVIAIDDEGFATSLDARNLPANATFTGPQVHNKTLNFSPDFLQAGFYQIPIVAYDAVGDSTMQVIDITVLDAGNQPPTITNVIGDTTNVFIGETQLDTIIAIDPELDSAELSAVFSSPNMNFSWTGAGGTATGLFTYAPDISEAFAIFQVLFIATDFPGGAADTAITYYRVISFMRGDSDSDFKYTMNDIVYLIKYLFNAGQAPDPIEVGDVDANGAVNVADVAYLVNFMYGGGPPPPQ